MLQAGAAASVVAVTSPALAVGTPDAELSYLGRQFDKVRVDYYALRQMRLAIDEWIAAEDEARTRVLDEMVDRVDEIVMRVAQTPTTTLDGLRLKARIAADPDFAAMSSPPRSSRTCSTRSSAGDPARAAAAMPPAEPTIWLDRPAVPACTSRPTTTAACS